MRTVIIGAGIAGLWLAEQLAHAGDTVTVLEKYDYIGGRILTSDDGRELGAGRIHASHHRVHALLRRFGLHTTPLGTAVTWRSAETHKEEPNEFEAAIQPILAVLSQLPPRTLATHTLRELTESILGAQQARLLLERFPYRGETEVLRADLAIQSFATEMGTHHGYTVVTEGFSALTDRLAAAARAAGATIHLQSPVAAVTRATRRTYHIHVEGRPNPFTADRVIAATHVAALRKIAPFNRSPVIRHIQMTPLIRIYAKYAQPFRKSRTVTDSPLRYVIPVAPKIVMISYTEGRDTEPWANLRGDALRDAVTTETRALYGPRTPAPLWAKAAEWSDGCSYWTPGTYDPVVASRVALQPFREWPGLHMTGESFSVGQQAWVEGALAHAEQLLALLSPR